MAGSKGNACRNCIDGLKRWLAAELLQRVRQLTLVLLERRHRAGRQPEPSPWVVDGLAALEACAGTARAVRRGQVAGSVAGLC